MHAVDGKCLINDQWLNGEGLPTQRTSPADDRLVWTGHWSSVSQAQAAVAAAECAFVSWSQSSLEERIGLCEKYAEYVAQHRDELALLIAIETGKPLWEARTEVAATIGKVSNSVEAIRQRRWTSTQQLGDYSATTRFRPHGVMFVIGPFNFPAHLPGGHIIPALLAGNTIVFKPSQWVPATGQWLVEAWQTIGLPAGVLNLVHGAGEIGALATEQQAVAGILFTGSQRVGMALHRSLAGKPEKILALEMGGNNALVIHNARDIRAAAKTIILSAYITSGQRCTCARRLIVTEESGYQRIAEELQQLIPKIRVGLPLDDPQPFMGPLIHEAAGQHMLDAQDHLITGGASPLVRMNRDAQCAALLSPGLIEIGEGQVLDDCEHFGPLLVLHQASDLDHALEMANATRFGLSAGFIGDSADDFDYFLHRIRAGVVNWNRQTTGASGKLPFGGIGLSGNHQPSGFAADYCSYPIASLESHELSEAQQPMPGLEFADED